ncbi:MAG: hypothetical protein PHW69_00945 [Elusimicrobiaceae bacterium]|nr:hypothetical protein [Elusimicrobiaceae bacterium]
MDEHALRIIPSGPARQPGPDEAIEPEILEPGMRPDFAEGAEEPRVYSCGSAPKRGLVSAVLGGAAGLALAVAAGLFFLIVAGTAIIIAAFYGLAKPVLALFGIRASPAMNIKTFRFGSRGFGGH